MDEQRSGAQLQAREDRAQTHEAVDVGERTGGQREADAAERERAIDVVGAGPIERKGAPNAEGIAERNSPESSGEDDISFLVGAPLRGGERRA